MEDKTVYLRQAFVKWEALRPVHNLIVIVGLYAGLRYDGLPWLHADKDTLFAGLFALIVINAVYCFGPLVECALMVFPRVRLGRSRYALWTLMSVLPVYKSAWMGQMLTFYFMGTIYRG